MPRHRTSFDPFRPSSEAIQMDLRSSPSQQHLNPSRSSSLPSQQDDMDIQVNEKPHKLDLYSIPVFLLEVIVLVGLSYAAYFVHFQYQTQPFISGFYCDDISYRQVLYDSITTQQFIKRDNELACLALLLCLPIVLIIFCELVNSMFGSLKFRQIRALCTCCKLHSITRRTFRFCGAYLLGFMIVMISCDILTTSTGRLRPYFAQDCDRAYLQCRDRTSSPPPSSSYIPTINHNAASSGQDSAATSSNSQILTPGLQAAVANTTSGLQQAAAQVVAPDQAGRIQQLSSGANFIVERQWIDLTHLNLSEVCNFRARVTEDEDSYKFNQIAKSWPSFPAAVFTYACLFIACYLCFVGTARPLRIITCVLVTLLLLLATIFDVQLVKDHYHHWDDVVASAVLSFIVVVFVLMVYLNKFRDTHYYQNQKLFMNNRNASKLYVHDNLRGYSNEGASGQYNLDKTGGGESGIQNGADTAPGPLSNDLAMRYFQIPRANYRSNGPRPLTSISQMR